MNSDLLPEQKRALVYARRRGTEAPVQDIRGRVVGGYTELEALLRSLPIAVVQEHRPTSAWCIQEVVDHLVQSDRPAAHQLRLLLSGQDVNEPIPASLQSADPHGLDWQVLLQQLRTVHENLLEVLSRATDQTPLTATAAVQMVVKCATAGGALQPVSWSHRCDWKAYAILVYAHNQEHLAQVHRILGTSASG